MISMRFCVIICRFAQGRGTAREEGFRRTLSRFLGWGCDKLRRRRESEVLCVLPACAPRTVERHGLKPCAPRCSRYNGAEAPVPLTRDSSGNAADYACRDTPGCGIPGRARNDSTTISGIAADSPVGRSPMRPRKPRLIKKRTANRPLFSSYAIYIFFHQLKLSAISAVRPSPASSKTLTCQAFHLTYLSPCMADCEAASRAMGTRNGEHDT
jgi:hypothetical protein